MLSNVRFSSLTVDDRKATNSWIDGHPLLNLSHSIICAHIGKHVTNCAHKIARGLTVFTLKIIVKNLGKHAYLLSC